MASLSTNYSLYAIPAMVAVSYYPAFAKSALLTKYGVLNNVAPRGNISGLQAKPNSKVPPELVAKLARMESAHYNGLENLPFFGLSLLAANYAGVEVEKVNIAAALFIALRTIYNYIYINHTKTSTSYLRTLVWNIAFAIPFYLSFKAAAKTASH